MRIEESAEPLEAIARSVGFSDPERMRRAFIRVFGLSPQAIRRLGARDNFFATPGGGAHQRSNGCIRISRAN